MKRFLLSLIFSVFSVVNSWAESCETGKVWGKHSQSCIDSKGSCGGNCTYTIDEAGNLFVKGPTTEGTTGSLTWGRFSNNQDITNIEISGNISATNDAFQNMPNVKDIRIGDNVVVGSYAFQGNSASNIKIGKVETVGYQSFSNMPNLESVTFTDGSNPTFSAYVFSGSGGENSPTIVLPEGMTTISAYALGGMKNAKIIMPDSMTNLGYLIYAYGSNYTTYCKDNTQRSCSSMFTFSVLGTYTPENIYSYKKEDGMYVLEDENEKVYFSSAINMSLGNKCENTNTQQGLDLCKAHALQYLGKCVNANECNDIVNKAYAGEFFANGQFYASLQDLISNNHIKKRIYTVEEATNIAKGNKNTFSIRYR